MMQVNSRSVLRPEYLHYTTDYSVCSSFYSDKHSKPRVNTNTAPVFSTDNCALSKRKLAQRMTSHPYYYPVRESQISLGHGATTCMEPSLFIENGSLKNNSPLSKDESVQMSSSSSQRSPSSISSRSDSNVRKSPSSLSRMYSHGQSEQLRRSRESNTFALIDDQLSKPPLCQVRDMYLQSRLGINSTNSASTRTTKKANLSAVHTVVRFRIKDYLLPMLSHMRKMLDVLFSSLYPDYNPNMRDTLACELFGQSQLPCSRSCEFCERFRYQLARQVPNRKVFCEKSSVRNKSPSPSKLSLHVPDSSTPYIPRISSSVSLSDIPQRVLSTRQTLPTSSSPTPLSSPSPFFNFDLQEPSSNVDLMEELKDFVNEINTLPVSDGITDEISTSEENFSPSRKRLDSVSVHLLESFDLESIYWSATNMELGPSNDSTGLSDLIMDMNSDSKFDILSCDVTPHILESSDPSLKRPVSDFSSLKKVKKSPPPSSFSSNCSSSSSSSFTNR